MAQVSTSVPGDTTEVGRRLRAIRRRKGLSLNDVARGAGLTRRELVAYERGKARIPDGDLWCIAGSCGVDVSELVPTPAPESTVIVDGNISITDTIAHLRHDLARKELPALEAGDSSGRRRGFRGPLRRKPRALEAGSPVAPAPVVEVPTAEAPVADAPLAWAFAEAPVAEAPVVEAPDVDVPKPVFDVEPPFGATPSIDAYAELAALPDPVPLDHDTPMPDVLAPPPPPGTIALIDDVPLDDPTMAEPILVDPIVADDESTDIVSGADAPPIDVNAWTPARAQTDTREPVDVGANAGFWSGADPWSTPATDAWNAIEADGWALRDSSPWATIGDGVWNGGGWDTPIADAPADDAPVQDDPGSDPWARVDDVDRPWTLPPSTWEESEVPTPEPAVFAENDLSTTDELLAPAPTEEDTDQSPPPIWSSWTPSWGTTPDPEAISTGFYIDWGTEEDAPAATTPVEELDGEGSFEPVDFETPFVLEPEPERIVWRVDSTGVAAPDDESADLPGLGEQFVAAGPDWLFGHPVPPVEVSDGGGLVMRRADERWALADVTTSPSFAVEVELDYRSGPGFGVLFRAELDDEDRMSGYSFDVDPAYEGGYYLVRQWVADRELWNPIARVPMGDSMAQYGPMTVRLVVEQERMTAAVNGEEILAVDDLSAASAGQGHPGPNGDRVGIQSWSSTDMVLDVLRVAAR